MTSGFYGNTAFRRVLAGQTLKFNARRLKVDRENCEQNDGGYFAKGIKYFV